MNRYARSGRQHGSEEERRTNRFLYALQIGFFAGLLFGMLRWMFYLMQFTKELPGFLVKPFYKDAFLAQGWGGVTGVVFFILFSIGAAMLYMLLMGRLKGPWPGIVYGAVWWALLFAAAGPFLGLTMPAWKAGWNTFSTEICVFVVWGLFIGYSIAFEFTDEASREPAAAH